MTDAKTYVDFRWGTRNRDERKRLMSAYEAGQKQEGKMTTERTPDYWDGWNDAVESIQNIALRAKVPSPEARVAEAVSPSGEVEETADERCACGHSRAVHFHDPQDDVDWCGNGVTDGCYIDDCGCDDECPHDEAARHAFKPVEEPVSPPSPSEPTASFRPDRKVEEDRKPVETAETEHRPCRVCGQPPLGWNHVKLGAHEWVPANTAVDERPLTVTSDGETAEVCWTCGKPEPAYFLQHPEHSEEAIRRGDGHIYRPFPAPEPVEAAPVEPLEGEWGARTALYRFVDRYEPDLPAKAAFMRLVGLHAKAVRSTAERRLEGHENLAAAAIRERDEARGEVERLQAALEEALLWWRVNGLGGRLNCYCESDWARENNPCGVCRYERCEAVLKSSAEARVSTPVREERGG